MALLLQPDIKRDFEESMLSELQHDDSGFFTNEGHINEPRVVAENVQEMCKRLFASCFDSRVVLEDHSSELTRRSMGDIYVIDNEHTQYFIDVKTHNLGTKFNMPNLTSVDRLSKYYSRPNTDNYFLILLVEYNLSNQGVEFTNIKLFPIENLSWECLHIQSLGWGQIQIKNANNTVVVENFTREQWMSQFYDRLNSYYKKVIKKAKKRQDIMQTRSEEWND